MKKADIRSIKLGIELIYFQIVGKVKKWMKSKYGYYDFFYPP